MSSFKPKQQQRNTNGPRVFEKYPTPEGGNQTARISLIVDLGDQEREDFVDQNTKETRPQAPVQQVAIFADLVEQEVDYGGEIGVQQYRLMLNKNFMGDILGVNFSAVPPRDGEGNMIKDKKWTFHPANLLTKLAKATGKTEIIDPESDFNMDIGLLLGQALMVEVEVVEKVSDKKDDKGEPIVFTNVRPKGYGQIPKIKGKLVDVDPLKQEPIIVTFDNATEETVKYLRPGIIAKIKKALNYQGSQIQAVLEGLGDTGGATPPRPEPEESNDDGLDNDDPF